MIGALILVVFASPRKKKEILIEMPKNAAKQILNKSLSVIGFQYLITKGSMIIAEKKKRINARVKGGMLVRANLKIGDAIPQIIFVMIIAKIGFITFKYYSFF